MILKSELVGIRYANGTKEEFADTATPAVGTTTNPDYAPSIQPPVSPVRLNSGRLYQQGKDDALLFYRGNGNLWASGVPSFFSPLGGLITSIIVAAVPPGRKNYIPSNIMLMNEPDYLRGYQKQAHRRKVGKVATGFAVGTGLSLILSAIILSGR